MRDGRIKVVVVPLLQRTYALWIKPTKLNYEQLVQGPPAGFPFRIDGVDFHAVIRHDGKTSGQPFCRFIGPEPVAGQFFVTKLNPTTGENYSPTARETFLIQSYFDLQYESGKLEHFQKVFGRWGLDLGLR